MHVVSFVSGALMILGTALLLVAEAKEISWLRTLSKVLAATPFLAIAWSHGALTTTYGQFMMAGLVFCWLGDLLLLSHEEPLFLAGIGAFLLGHVGYSLAFLQFEFAATWVLGSAAVLLGIAAVVLRWLRPHIEGFMRQAVVAYVAVIVAMVALAIGAFGVGSHWLIPAGAIVFFLSDLSVARDRFVSPGFGNRIWGLPVYFLAQWMLATSVATTYL